MRLTKRQLKRIIREEKRKLDEGPQPRWDDPHFPFDWRQKEDESGGLYTNLSEQSLSALDALRDCIQTCVSSGCKEADIMDTVKSVLKPGRLP
jgi:hypothetical protein